MLSEHQIEHTGLRFDRYGRTGKLVGGSLNLLFK